MQVTDESDLKLDAALRRAAESEMRRTLPGDERPNKRAKGEYAGQVGRFDYSSVRDLASGVQGFLIWSDFRR